VSNLGIFTTRHRRGQFGDILSCAAFTHPNPRVSVVSPRALRIVTLGRFSQAKCRKSSRFDDMGAFSRIRNVRQSAAASDAARVHKHEMFICGHGGHVYRRYLGGPRVEYRLLEVPFCEHAMRGSSRPHPTLLVVSNTKWAYAVTGDMSIVGILEGLGVNIVCSRAIFYENALRGRNGPHPALLVSSCTKRTYAATADMSIVSISEGPGVNIVYRRSHFANTQCEAVRRSIRRC